MRHLLYLNTHMTEVPEGNGARLLLERTKKQLSREERVAFGFITACGAGALILGSLFFMSNVKKPFLITYNGPRYVSSSEKESEQEALQRITDTDEDGVSDYDELRIFGTSPYIADTDSDGKNDGSEIAQGEDPNCVTGKTCITSETVQLPTVGGFTNIVEPEQSSQTATPEEVLVSLKQLSIPEVREFLVEAGISAEEVNAMNDEQVMEFYTAALAQAEEGLAEQPQGGDTQQFVNEVLQTP